MANFLRMGAMLKQKTSFWTAILIGVLFAWGGIKEIVEHKDTNCFAAYDQFGYYAYLPAVFIYDDLKFEGEWATTNQANCGNPGVYQFSELGEGKKVNIYHAGLAFVQLPGFLIADVIARNTQFERNGHSLPYYAAARITAILFIFLGIFFLRATLKLFFSEGLTSLVILLIYGATNVYITFFYGELMPHLYLFALNAVFTYYVLRFRDSRLGIHLLLAAFVLGLSTAIRPTQAIWGVVPFVVLLEMDGISRKTLGRLVVLFLGIVLLNLPQVLYWKVYGGSWFLVNLHSETLNLGHPHILDFLFSYKKGWLLYSPLFVVALLGWTYLYRHDKSIARSFILLFVLNLWVLSSWDCWWYAASFGSRVMVDSYVIFAIGLGFFLKNWPKSMVSRGLILALCCGFSYFSLVQSYQFYKGWLPTEHTTRDHYWYIFGKWDFPQIDRSLQEIDRFDLDWPSNRLANHSLAAQYGYAIIETSHFPTIDNISFNASDEYVGVYQGKISDLTPTDEGQLRLRIKTVIDHCEAQQPITLVFTIENKTHYFVRHFDFLDQAENNEFVFNLPHIRSFNDSYHVFLANWSGCAGSIEQFEVNIRYLERN